MTSLARSRHSGSSARPIRNRKGAIVSFTMEGTHPHDLAQLLDRHGIAIRAGHHSAMPLHVRLGIPASARASFSMYNTIAEIDRLGVALESIRLLFRRPLPRTGGAAAGHPRSDGVPEWMTLSDREEILDHYYSSPHRGHLESPTWFPTWTTPSAATRFTSELSLAADGRIDGCGSKATAA